MGKSLEDPPWPVKTTGRLQIPLQIQFCPDKSPEEQWGNPRREMENLALALIFKDTSS